MHFKVRGLRFGVQDLGFQVRLTLFERGGGRESEEGASGSDLSGSVICKRNSIAV